MKKMKKLGFIAAFSFAIVSFSCTKHDTILPSNSLANDETSHLKRNEATIIFREGSRGPWYDLRFAVGHTAQQCGGKCIKLFGEYTHVNCVGFGNVCNYRVIVSVDEDGTISGNFKLTTSDVNALGSSLIFPFPDRSLMITNPQNNTDLWLNIPEQVLQRNNENESFIFHDAWFSENAELVNL